MNVYYKGRVIADDAGIADSFWTRFRGLMGRKSLKDGEGLLLTHCPSVHCFFMKIPIDAVHLSKDMTVLGVETLPPWSVGRRIRGTAHILELRAGGADVAIGDFLEFSGNGVEQDAGNR